MNKVKKRTDLEQAVTKPKLWVSECEAWKVRKVFHAWLQV